MVGSRSGGTMKDSDVEGWSGYRVDQINVRAQVIVPFTKPNVVLINGGTNDATQNYNVLTVGDRMRGMINFIYSQSPGVSIVLSTLLPKANFQGNHAAQGQKIVLCEMDDGFLTTADLPDGTHPNDGGYKKMASKWHQAIGQLETSVVPSGVVSFSDAAGASGMCDRQSSQCEPQERPWVDVAQPCSAGGDDGPIVSPGLPGAPGSASPDPDGDELTTTILTADPIVWNAPTVHCNPPCIVVFPPKTLVTAQPSIPLPTLVITGTFAGVTAAPVARVISPPPPWPYGSAFSFSLSSSSSLTTDWPAPPVYEGDPDPPIMVTSAFPSDTATWVTESVPGPTTKVVDGQPWPVIPCWAWFIWSCPPNVGGIVLKGWGKPGIYPRGGPPPLPSITSPGLRFPPFPWPNIEVLPDLTPSYPEEPEPDEQCETAIVDICTTTTSYGIVARRGGPTPTETTTTTETIESCTQVTGCGREDITATTTESSTATAVPLVIFPSNPHSVDDLRVALHAMVDITNVYESSSSYLGTIFFFYAKLTQNQVDYLDGRSDVDGVKRRSVEDGLNPGANIESPGQGNGRQSARRSPSGKKNRRTQLLEDAHVRKMIYIIQAITDQGALFVTGSGNWAAGAQHVYGCPALLADPSHANHVPNMLVVGGAFPDGSYVMACSDSPFVDVYAPSKPLVPHQRCGEFCRGFYCPDSPIKTNPDFLDPRNPDSVQNPSSPNHNQWTGADPRDPADPGVISKDPQNPFPTITGTPAPTDCVSTTSTVQCVGNGGRQACYTQTGVCVKNAPPMPTPSVISSVSCPTNQVCLITKAQTTNCQNVARTAIPDLPAATLTTSSPDPKWTSAPSSPRGAAIPGIFRRDVEPQPAPLSNATDIAPPGHLAKRQSNQVCDTLLTCQQCGTVRYVPCVRAEVKAYVVNGGTDLIAKVYIDGTERCEARGRANCEQTSDANGNPCWNVFGKPIDCGGGSQILWEGELITLYHDGNVFPLSFGPKTSTTQYQHDVRG
ncbi:hypothetical protein B0T16DRAFT_395177 [Cercophora newfieldiana]|uniref:SGNH hydrolase-type esterase domain-containing protein n=1 Tax=Cercophora newfieldiana TaxID=92897 RepID=A0AA39XTD2_9PEZI|nr:hypothetical protein B0T16DRAFT_395177 [Cercophora newfieldiana]